MATTTATSNQPTLLDWLAFALKVRESRQSGSFVMPPMTPQQQAMYDRVNKMLDSSPTTTAFQPILGYDLSHPATLDMAALKRGDIGFTPAQHMSPEDLAKVLANANHPGVGTPQPTAPPPGGGPTTGVVGDPFGHIGAPVGSQGDTFGNWPGPSPTAHNVTWDDIKKYGPQAVSVANSIISATPGILFSAVVAQIQKLFGGKSDKADDGFTRADSKTYQPDLSKNPPNPREPWQMPYTGTTQPTPSATTGMPGGSYDANYGGGGGPDFDAKRMIRQSQLRGLLATGQSV